MTTDPDTPSGPYSISYVGKGEGSNTHFIKITRDGQEVGVVTIKSTSTVLDTVEQSTKDERPSVVAEVD